MKTTFFDTTTRLSGRYAATIGFFDGVHLGHRFLIRQLMEAARERGLQPMVVTFEMHPRQVIQPQWEPQLLTTLAEKAHFIEETGVDELVVLRFDRAMAQLSARDFMQTVLHDRLGVALLLTGYDNRFGHNREEGLADYQRYGSEMGMEVVCGRPLGDGELRYSSSLVRRLLSEGSVSVAARCLGRHYTLTGRVVHGEQIGRTLGFPTANICVEQTGRMLPANGVYAVRVQPACCEQAYCGVMNIGLRPTFSGHERTLEVNIFDFIGDLYERELTVAFIERLRDERHFDTSEALVEQMHADAAEARRILKNY